MLLPVLLLYYCGDGTLAEGATMRQTPDRDDLLRLTRRARLLSTMKTMNRENDTPFQEAVRGFVAGDFSRLAPLFETPSDGSPCPVIKWFEGGLFASEPKALEEAFTCACFNGCINTVEYFLAKGVNPSGGINTGLNAFHWAANRGQLKTVEDTYREQVSARNEKRVWWNGFGLRCMVSHVRAKGRPHSDIEALLSAGAEVGAADYPSGDERVDEVLRRMDLR